MTILYDLVAAQQQKVDTVLDAFISKTFSAFFPGIMVALQLVL